MRSLDTTPIGNPRRSVNVGQTKLAARARRLPGSRQILRSRNQSRRAAQHVVDANAPRAGPAEWHNVAIRPIMPAPIPRLGPESREFARLFALVGVLRREDRRLALPLVRLFRPPFPRIRARPPGSAIRTSRVFSFEKGGSLPPSPLVRLCRRHSKDSWQGRRISGGFSPQLAL